MPSLVVCSGQEFAGEADYLEHRFHAALAFALLRYNTTSKTVAMLV